MEKFSFIKISILFLSVVGITNWMLAAAAKYKTQTSAIETKCPICGDFESH